MPYIEQFESHVSGRKCWGIEALADDCGNSLRVLGKAVPGARGGQKRSRAISLFPCR